MHGIFMYGICMLSQAHNVSFCKMCFKEDTCLLGSVGMHVQGTYITGHYVVVNTGCLCVQIA